MIGSLDPPGASRALERLLAEALIVGLPSIVLPAAEAGAQEKRISLSFTKELLYNIARDNEGQMTDEIVSRLLGLSPAVADVDIIRSGADIILAYTFMAADKLPVRFRLIVEKLAFYRMAAAREDVSGMLAMSALKTSGTVVASPNHRKSSRVPRSFISIGPTYR